MELGHSILNLVTNLIYSLVGKISYFIDHKSKTMLKGLEIYFSKGKGKPEGISDEDQAMMFKGLAIYFRYFKKFL